MTQSKHTLEPFTIRFSDIDNKTGKVFKTYETESHGWQMKNDFLKMAKNKGGQFFENGYFCLRCDGLVTTKVELI